MKLRTTLSVIVRALGTVLAGCGGSSSGVSSDPSIVGIWGVTTTVAQGASSQIDETYVVYGSDMTVRDFFRTTTKVGTSTTSTSLCGSGTYVFANGVLSTTIREKSTHVVASDPNNRTTITKTVTATAKIELIDESMRLTTDVDGSSNVAVYERGTLPDGLEASCPK